MRWKLDNLFISDLDGTLLDKNAKLSETSLNILNNLIKDGLNFTVATGRTPISAKNILNKLNINLPMIFMNGALITDSETAKILFYEAISPNSCSFISECEKEFDIGGLILYVKNNALHSSLGEAVNTHWKSFFKRNSCENIGFSSIKKTNSFLNLPVLYSIYIDTNPHKLKAFADKLTNRNDLILDFYPDMYHNKTWCLEVYSSKSSKKEAVKILKEITKAKNVVAFGDNLNDLSLFSICDEGIAVENAHEDVKKSATRIIGKNTEDSVAKYLKSIYKH